MRIFIVENNAARGERSVVEGDRRSAGIAAYAVLHVLTEHLERYPGGHTRHARHARGHRTRWVDDPRIETILEPESDHVMLAVRRAVHNRAVDFGFGKAQVAQCVIDQQLESIAIVTVASQGLFESRPVIDRTVGDMATDALAS